MFDIDKYMTKPFLEHGPGPGCPPPPPTHCGHPHFTEKPRYTMTEEVEHTARLMRETIDRLLKFEQRAKEDIDTLSKNVMSDNVIFKNTMHEAWTTFLMEVKNEINVFEGNIEADIRMFKSEVETDYANLSEDCRNQIAENLATYEQKVADYEAKYETEWGAFKTSYEQAFTELRTSIQAQYNAFVNAVNSRIDEHNESCAQAFADYQRKLNTELNSFENTMNTNYSTFTESIGNSMHEFKTYVETTMNERLANQDGKISDAESYMKTNLEATVTTLIGDMHANGDFTEIIEGEVFNDLQRKVDGMGLISVLYFGVVGDGETDDTEGIKLANAHGKPVNLVRRSVVITDTIDLSVPFLNGTIIYKGDASKPVFNMKNGGALKNVTIVIGVNNYASSVVLADYTAYSESNNPMRFVVDGLVIDNTICQSFVEGSACIKFRYDKYKVITNQNIENVRFIGHMDYGFYFEPILRNENDNPVFNTSIFKNVFFGSVNCALKVLPTMATGSLENAKGGVNLLLANFANQHVDGINKAFMDVLNTTVNGVAVIPWDYYGDNIPACGTYVCTNSKILLDFDYFPSITQNDSVKYGWTYMSTGEAFTNHNVIKVDDIVNRSPYRGDGSAELSWGVDNVKAIRFNPAVDNPYDVSYIGFELQRNNHDDPNCDRVVQFGFNDNGTPYVRKFNADEKAWGDLERIFKEGSMPTSYAGKRPNGKAPGDMKFDTTVNKPVWWTGTEWVLADGTPL